MGPTTPVRRYGAYCVKGYKFQTSKYEEKRTTQNNGVLAMFTQTCFSSVRDFNPAEGQICYYGQIEDIVEVFYGADKQFSHVMFDVRWCKAAPSKDRFGFQTINLTQSIYSDERFMFANQAEQCFYVKDPNVNNLWVVLRKPPRAIFDGGSHLNDDAIESDEIEPPQAGEETCIPDFHADQLVEWNGAENRIREEIPSVIIESSTQHARNRRTQIHEAVSYVMTKSKKT
jgi:hypothetical protein